MSRGGASSPNDSALQPPSRADAAPAASPGQNVPGSHWPRRLAQGAGIALCIHAGGLGLRYAWQVLFARWMGADEYGSFAFAFGWMQVLAVVCAVGLTTGVLRFIPRYIAHGDWGRVRGLVRRSRQVTIGAGAALAATASLVLVVLAPARVDITALIVALWLVPLLGLGNLQLEITRATQRVARAYAPMRLLHPALAIAFGFVVFRVTSRLTDVGGLAALGLSLVVTAVAQEALIRSSLPRESRAATAVFESPFWLRESVPLLLVAGFVIVLSQTDVIMVGTLLGTREAGIYAAAAVTARLVNSMLHASNAAAAPMIAAIHARGDRDGLQRLVSRAARWTFWPSLTIAGAVVVFSTPVLSLFGREFMAARAALIVLAGGQLVNASMGPVGHLMSLTGHGRRSAVVLGVAATTNIALNLLLVPRVGLVGAAVATATAMVLWNVWLYALVRRHLGVRSFAFAR